MVVYAAVEGGGTTFRAALAEGTPDNITDRAEFETTTPGRGPRRAVRS